MTKNEEVQGAEICRSGSSKRMTCVLSKDVSFENEGSCSPTIYSQGSVKSELTPFSKEDTYKGNHGSINDNQCSVTGNNFSDQMYAQNSVKETDCLVSGIKFERQRSLSARKPTRRRFVEKDGKFNVRSKTIPRERYIQDVFTTIIDARWKWMILLFVTFYLGSWLLFGVVWYILLLVQGEECFTDVVNFTEAFMLALETSMTIGYGGRSVSSKCPGGIMILIVQSLISCLIEACVIGLIFTKLQRPGKRKTTILFSKKAVVTKRDDKICLMFNTCDVRKRQLLECHVRLHLFRTYKTLEGKTFPNHQDQLRVGMDWYNIRDDSDRLLMIFPSTLVHVIDRKSPFYHISRDKYKKSDWELVVILEGTVEATGCSVQARTSYLPDEVVWGGDFANPVDSEDWSDNKGIEFHLSRFNKIVPAPYVPDCSAAEYYKSVNKDPDPNDVYGEQDELWDDTNFTEPIDGSERVLRTHAQLNKNSENNLII